MPSDQPIQGKRVYLTGDDLPHEMGDYGKALDGNWYCRIPASGFGIGKLSAHQVVEHEDGTITVSPSILATGTRGRQWHGYLERGVWREV
jgi:hypothetical protein